MTTSNEDCEMWLKALETQSYNFVFCQTTNSKVKKAIFTQNLNYVLKCVYIFTESMQETIEVAFNCRIFISNKCQHS